MVSIVRATFLVVLSVVLVLVLSVEALNIRWYDKCKAPPIRDRDSYWLCDYWYVVQVSKNTNHPEKNQKCITYNLVLLQQDNGYSVSNIAINIHNDSLVFNSYYARIASPSTVAATLHFEPYYEADISQNTIIATDHRTYAVIVKCQPDYDQDLVQVMSKSTELSLTKKNEVRAKLVAANYNPEDLMDIDQIDC